MRVAIDPLGNPHRLPGRDLWPNRTPSKHSSRSKDPGPTGRQRFFSATSLKSCLLIRHSYAWLRRTPFAFRFPCEKIRGFWPRNRVLARNPPASEGKGHPPAAKAQVGEIDARQNVANRARTRFGGHFRADSGHGTALWHGPASAGARPKIATWPFVGNSLRGAPEPCFFVPERGFVAKNRAHANMEGRGARKGRRERRGEDKGQGARGKGRRRQRPQCANHDLAPNDMRFFKNTQEFTKTYLKKIRKKRFPSE